jgi:hypothetical protein
MPSTLSPSDLASLRQAKALLEQPGLLARLANIVGQPIDAAIQKLPERVRSAIRRWTRFALETSLAVALRTLDPAARKPAWPRLHKLCVSISGGVGGFIGIAAVPIELPLSTSLMFRSVAEIARAEGEDLGSPDAALACLQVFALGGRSASDDAADSAYFETRIALARALAKASEHLATRGLAAKEAPALVRLLVLVSERFSVQLSAKQAAQVVAVVGAASGAAVNVAFLDHFQDMARGHFTVRRLERKYGAQLVHAAYAQA